MLLLSDPKHKKGKVKNGATITVIGCTPFKAHVPPDDQQHKAITVFSKVTSMAGA